MMVGSKGNVLCLGRSGTGKTTTSVLRMFALEILYKMCMKREIMQERLNLDSLKQ
jgi:anion-transporting  ArsA/GET3 family ATPase